MSVRHLEFLFRPRTIAVIGACNEPGSIGAVVMRNLLQEGFAGPIMPVNPTCRSVTGVLTYPDVETLPMTPDLGVICTLPSEVPRTIEALGRRGTRAAAVLTSGLGWGQDAQGCNLRDAMLEAARPYGLRILGSNCLGLMVPSLNLNASFAHTHALPGKLAFVSQSAALCAAVLDWASSKGIGFSHFVSVGNCDEVSSADVVDYLGTDPLTLAILLYIESVKRPREFISAVRAAARNKPVLAIKAGRMPEGARAASSHTGALAGNDDVYDAAFRRAGVLRVYDIDELFDAVETLARSKPRLGGDRLAIVCNGGGPGILAVDSLAAGGGHLARFSEDTMRALDRALPWNWSRCNPVDILCDASSERYTETLKTLLKDPGVDAILVMHVPTALANSEMIAHAVMNVRLSAAKAILTSWLGGHAADKCRALFADAGIPTYETPDKAVRAFLHMMRYRRSQEMLMETPPSVPTEFTPNTAEARAVAQRVLAEGREQLSECEAKEMLAAYGIPVVESHIVLSTEEAVETAEQLGFPVVLKIISPDVIHKSDVGGVALNLKTPEAIRLAAESMKGRLRELNPAARHIGYCVQKMVRRQGAYELIIGVATDPTFGMVLLFGQGGTAVEVIADRAVALPPLNMALARELISRTRVFRLLQGYRDHRAVDLDALCLTLVQVSQLCIDLPELVELDVNPLVADENGVLALDAHVRVAPPSGAKRLAIRPYPKQLEETIVLPSGRMMLLRPIRPEDERTYHAFLTRLTPEDIRFRYFGLVRDFPHSQLARQTQIDYDREMVFIATGGDDAGLAEVLAEVRVVTDPDNTQAEFAIAVRSDIKGQGLGHTLLDKMIRYCRTRGTRKLVGQVLPDNIPMLGLAKGFGFQSRPLPDEDVVEVRLTLGGKETVATPVGPPSGGHSEAGLG